MEVLESARSREGYPYSPLVNPGDIRILVIQPGTSDSPIHCSLNQANLQALDSNIYESYTALSYVWGDPKNRKEIFIDNYAVSITANLFNAIRDLRDEKRCLWLWVDAVCIDQSNIPERGQQVELMGVIYGVANKTVVYLGGPNKAVEEILNHLREIPYQGIGEWRPGYQNTEKQNETRFAALSSAHTRIQDDAFDIVLSLPWFDRVWVLQELVLSRVPWVQVIVLQNLCVLFVFFPREAQNFY